MAAACITGTLVTLTGQTGVGGTAAPGAVDTLQALEVTSTGLDVQANAAAAPVVVRGIGGVTVIGASTLGGPLTIESDTGIAFPAGTITTVQLANSGLASGNLTLGVTGAGDVNLRGSVVTSGAANNAGAGSAAGDVTIATADGSVLIVTNLLAAGGDSTAAGFDGGAGGNITVTVPVNGVYRLLPGDASGARYFQPAEVIVFGDPAVDMSILVDADGGLGGGGGGVNGVGGAIALSPAGRAGEAAGPGGEPPVAGTATIWGKVPGARQVTFEGAAFTMGLYEKLTSLGSLRIDVDGQAQIGDLTAVGSLTVAGTPLFRTRPTSAIVVLTGGGTVDGLFQDRSLDYIAGGALNIPGFGAVENAAFPAPAAGSGGGGNFRGGLPTVLGVPPVQYDENPAGNPGTNTAPDGTEIWLLDVLESGVAATGAGLATSLAGALPDHEVQIAMDTTVISGEERLDLVRHLGIYTRDVTDAELQAFLAGWRFILDSPEYAHIVSGGDWFRGDAGSPAQYKVLIDRLPSDLARKAMRMYRELYWREKVDQKAGRKMWRSRAAEIRGTLQKSIDAFKAQNKGKFDPAAYRRWLAATPAQKDARGLMDRLAALFRQVELLGLGPVELKISQRMLARPIRPKGVTVQELIDAVLAAGQAQAIAAKPAK